MFSLQRYSMLKRAILTLIFVLLCGILMWGVSAAQNGSSAQRINGTVVGIGGRPSARSRSFSLIVNRYTTPSELTELVEAISQGEDQLLRSLSRMNAVRIQVGPNVGVPANAIIATPWENGTRLTVLYERKVNFFELRYGTRSSDYRFGYAEIFLDRAGRGKGTLIGAARMRLKGGNTWGVEDFGVYPAQLMGLRASGSIMSKE